MKIVRKKKLFTIVTLLCVGLGWGQFSHSGTTITQTGTANNLSGLASVSGVSVITLGEHTIYEFTTATTLIVEGTLHIANGVKEQLKIEGDSNNNTQRIDVKSGGSIIVGNSTEESHEQEFNGNIPAIVTGGTVSDGPTGIHGEGVNGKRPALTVRDGGSFEAYGQRLNLRTGIGVFEGGTMKLKNVDLDARDIYCYSPTSEFENVRSNLAIPQLAEYAKLDNWFTTGGGATYGSFQSVNLSISYSTPQIELDVRNIGDGKYRYLGDWGSSSNHPIFNAINAFLGADYESTSRGTYSGQSYLINFIKEVKFDLKDLLGANVEGVVYLDGGLIATSQTTPLGHSITGIVQETNKHTFTTNNGTTGLLSVSLGSNELPNTSTNPVYTRTSTNNAFNAYYFAYGYLPSQEGLDLAGNNSLEVERVLFVDPNISEANKATVDAYTEIDTLDELYDRAKSWKVDNIDEEFPTTSDQLITSDGSKLDLGSLNLMIDANASQAFSVNTSTNTLTIKASSLSSTVKFSSIVTTGTVTAQNGATIEFGYVDSSGKNVLLDFYWGTPDIYDVVVIDLNDNSTITTFDDQQQSVKDIFVTPTPFGSGVKVDLFADKNDSSTLFYTTTLIDSETLEFSRRSSELHDISTDTTGAAQHEALFLARKILQKTESMSAALEGTTPSLGDDTTTTTSGGAATKENQEAIKNLLLRILTKTTTTHEALKGVN
jgi:hypothetical protein